MNFAKQSMQSTFGKTQAGIGLLVLAIFVGFSYIFTNYEWEWENPKHFFTNLYAEQKKVGHLKQTQQAEIPSRADELKRILLWTPFFGGSTLRDYMLGDGDETSQKAICKFQCEFTTNKELLESSDAVLFHARDLESTSLMESERPANVPEVRSASQQWIFYLFESPANTLNPLEAFRSFFNLTMSYRTDSDIYVPYRRLLKRPSGKEGKPSSFEILKKKGKLVAWAVSNCHTQSEREVLVEELQRYIPVDIDGGCGDKVCPEKDPTQQSCYKLIGESYKFYFSFENSLCKDYVTEKFFNALDAGMVPIVYGGADYRHHAPEGSYIDVNSFASMKDLADYMLMLDRNNTEYLQYFAWRDQYQVDSMSFLPRAWCTLCERLTTGALPSGNVIEDVKAWWFRDTNGSSLCSPSRIPLMNK